MTSDIALQFDANDVAEKCAREMLRELGVPADGDAHEYLVTALSLARREPRVLRSVTRRLYPEVARRCNTNAMRVERTIRHAVERLWSDGDIERLDAFFGAAVEAERGKPTNSVFLAVLAERLRLTMR